MDDVFISYARSDDSEHDVQNFVSLLKNQYKKKTGDELRIFIDFQSLDVGDNWPNTIENAAFNSNLMIAFLSPTYFKSIYCAKEWDYFFNKIENEENQLILPLELIPLENKKHGIHIINDLDNEQKKIYMQSQTLQIGKLSEFGNHEELKEELINELCFIIKKKLSKIKPKKPEVSNTHVIDKEIENFKASVREKVFKKIESIERAYKDIKPVCVIYTGGTVGMVREMDRDKDSILKIGGVDQLITHMYKMKELDFDIDFYSYENPLDSSNIISHDWIRLAQIIKALYPFYQGFVILHGANTMAYTASALSFIIENLAKPVVLTGAEIPLIYLNSDAEHNVLRAIQAAAPEAKGGKGNIPEVCILFGNSLIRGNRATKKYSLNTSEGFYSPNYPPLGTIDHNEISLKYRDLRKIAYNKLERDKLNINIDILTTGVLILEVYPDMELDYYKSIFEEKSIRGIIIKTYGTGNIPDLPDKLLIELEKAVKRGVIVVNITQCHMGKVELKLFETNARLFDIGVINGGDMVTEAAYCKLKYLLGKYPDKTSKSLRIIKQEMQINKRGELTFSSHTFSYNRIDDITEVTPIFKGTPKSTGHFDFDPSNIDHAYLRLQGIKLINANGENLDVKIYADRNSITQYETDEDYYYKIGSFKRRINSRGAISHNLEITDKIRRIIKPKEPLTIQVVSVNSQSFKFESLELTIFTRDR